VSNCVWYRNLNNGGLGASWSLAPQEEGLATVSPDPLKTLHGANGKRTVQSWNH
jgi:hypothetical protein